MGRAAGTLHRWRDSPDRLPAVVWLASRLSVYIAAWYATWMFASRPADLQGEGIPSGPATSFVESWNRWDADRFRAINEFGYGAPGDETNFAFFPGFPGVVKVLGLLQIDLTLAGLIVSFLAGLVAAVALGRLTGMAGGRPELGVLAWAVAPFAVYLASPHSEALFCAFAFWAWYAALRGRWWTAGLLGMAASVVRVNGVFLAVALVVLFLTTAGRPWRKMPALALPFLGTLMVFAYFRVLSGSWTIWFWAQGQGWGRRLTDPIEAWRTMWDWSWNFGVASAWAVQYRSEILAVTVLAAFTIVLLVMRRWGEAVLVALTMTSLATSTIFQSVPRSMLVLFPIWILIGQAMSANRVIRVLVPAVLAPLMLVNVAAFVNGYWVS
jgi:hypothetical protein